MTTVAPPVPFTPDDILRLEEEVLYELVDGRLVEKAVSSLSSKTAGIITARLVIFLQRGGGAVYPEQSFRCYPDPNLVRRPDIAVIVADRVKEVAEEGHVTIAPDLAIEVVSPSDNVYELDQKINEYRSAGVKLIWVINPKGRVMRIYRPDHSISELAENDLVSGEMVLPGYSVPLREMLPAPVAIQLRS